MFVHEARCAFFRSHRSDVFRNTFINNAPHWMPMFLPNQAWSGRNAMGLLFDFFVVARLVAPDFSRSNALCNDVKTGVM